MLVAWEILDIDLILLRSAPSEMGVRTQCDDPPEAASLSQN